MVDIINYSDDHLLFGLIFMLENRLQAAGDNLYEEITSKQWFALAMLQLYEDNPPMLNELAQTMGSSHQNVKQIILKLKEKGYVELYPDEKDKRKLRVKMSDKVNDLSQKYDKKEIEFMKQLFENVESEELKCALKVLSTMQNNLDAMLKV